MSDSDTYRRAEVLMDTLVSIQVVCPASVDDCAAQVERAFEWFRQVEARCTRFDEQSEIMALRSVVGEPVTVSPLLFEAINFAVNVAEASGGAFDPTIGYQLERRGFNRNYRTGQIVASNLTLEAPVTYRDVLLDSRRKTVTLRRPTIIDLGAVAKGMAIDLAARELRSFPNIAIDAGGDLYLRGHNELDEPWLIGIRHPRIEGALLDQLRIVDAAVCTSGDYERSSDTVGEHHIVDPKTGHSGRAVASVTVVAPNAMLADALGTAAFVLGPERGIAFLDRYDVDGLIVTGALDRYQTTGFTRYSQ